MRLHYLGIWPRRRETGIVDACGIGHQADIDHAT
jgi:hypothetical protein